MTQQPDSEGASPPSYRRLKIAEPEVDAENPWGDDVLGP